MEEQKRTSVPVVVNVLLACTVVKLAALIHMTLLISSGAGMLDTRNDPTASLSMRGQASRCFSVGIHSVAVRHHFRIGISSCTYVLLEIGVPIA